MKKVLLILFLIALIIFGTFYLYQSGMFSRLGLAPKTETLTTTQITTEILPPKDELYNMDYIIDGEMFALSNGMGVDSQNTSTLKIIDQPVFGDLNKDGNRDAALWLKKETSNSDTLFYATIAINEGDTFKSESSVLLGENITPETIVIIDNQATYQFQTQTNNTTTNNQLTVGFDTSGTQVIVLPSSTNPAINTAEDLLSKNWSWVKTTYTNTANTSVPLKTLILRMDLNGTFTGSTDCSGIGGKYELNNNDIIFGDMPGTLLYCGGIEETDFRQALKEVVSFQFLENGDLTFQLKNGGGIMYFQ